jgi:hypothetical protein
MLLSHHQNAGQNRDIKIANRASENMSQFKYLGMTITNRNLIQEEIKRMKSGNACYNSAQNLLSALVLLKNINIRIHKSIILPMGLYVCETWPLILREEHRLMVFKNRMLSGIFGLKRDEVTGRWRKLHNEKLHDLDFPPNIIRILMPRKTKWARLVARMGQRGMHISHLGESQLERDH